MTTTKDDSKEDTTPKKKTKAEKEWKKIQNAKKAVSKATSHSTDQSAATSSDSKNRTKDASKGRESRRHGSEEREKVKDDSKRRESSERDTARERRKSPKSRQNASDQRIDPTETKQGESKERRTSTERKADNSTERKESTEVKKVTFDEENNDKIANELEVNFDATKSLRDDSTEREPVVGPKHRQAIRRQNSELKDSAIQSGQVIPPAKRRQSVVLARASDSKRRESTLKPGQKRTKSASSWKAAGHVATVVGELSRSQSTPDGTQEHNKDQKQVSKGKKHWKAVENVTSAVNAFSTSQDIVQDGEENKSTKHEQKTKKKSRKSKVEVVLKPKEPTQEEVIDPKTVLKNNVFEVIKNAFGLAYTEEELRINVDNIYPLLKSLQLNPQSESVMDLVRDACMESSGDIDAKEFESVVLSLIKAQDDELWGLRIFEKIALTKEAEDKKQKVEEERLRLEEARAKAGFDPDYDDENEWAQYEKKLQEAENERKKEEQEDEQYDNLKMAFRFIDSDEDGFISTKDIYNLMMGLGEMLTDDELYSMMNVVDLDCDGKVNFQDFKNFLAPEKVDPNANLPQELKDVLPDTSAETAANANAENATPTPDVVGTDTDKAAISEAGKGVIAEKSVPVRPIEEVEELSAEEKERRMKRKRSMLYGYMSTPTTPTSPSTPVSTSTKVSTPSITEEAIAEEDDSVFKEEETSEQKSDETSKEDSADSCKPELNESEVDTPAEQIENIDTTADENKSSDTEEQCTAEQADASGHLQSIREEDETSTGGVGGGVGEQSQTEASSDKKTAPFIDNKRKLLSRQSSSASLKTRPSSGITDSVGDSGIDTMDTLCCSEIVDQPDVYGLSDEENGTGDQDDMAQSASTLRRSSKASKASHDIYNDDEDDEDMVEARHVRESLSRVPSSESLESLNELHPEKLDAGKDADDLAKERTRNFVNEHMYIEIESVNKEREERLKRAEHLQNTIFRQNIPSQPATVYTSRSDNREDLKPSVNGMSCPHIAIDLRCDSTPPMANVRSFREFSERIRNARTNKEDFNPALDGRRVSVVDLADNVTDNSQLPCQRELSKWPMRPLTRPRSPAVVRVINGRERKIVRVPTAEYRVHGKDNCIQSGDYRIQDIDNRVIAGSNSVQNNDNYVQAVEQRVPNIDHRVKSTDYRGHVDDNHIGSSEYRLQSGDNRRVLSARERFREDRASRTKRAMSAAPHRRTETPMPQPLSQNKPNKRVLIRRPQTAIPYTGSRRMEEAYASMTKHEDNVNVVISEPFVNADDMYPGKTALTSFHHGFKSIWPVGRSANVIREKRPFSAFEMNSYSRAIERHECPFKVKPYASLTSDNRINPNQITVTGGALTARKLSPVCVQRSFEKRAITPRAITPRTVR